VALLELRSITKDFPGVRALDGVSFDLHEGEVHALCGENGAGKSTLIKVLSGFYPAGTYGGEIALRGQVVRFRGLRAAEEHGIALIAQELALVPDLSVEENLVLGREPARGGLIRWREVRRFALEALALVGLEVDPARKVRELGIGQQQLVEIAKALGKKASILVLDEPTAALPEADVTRLLALLARLRAQGLAAVYISHRLEEVFSLADRVTVLRDGRSVATAVRAETTPAAVIAQMVGREVTSLYPRPPAGAGAPLLSVRGWSVRDPTNATRFAVQGVDFDLHAGEVLGVAGLMGAGRTALLSSLFGAARSAVAGTLRVGEAPPRGPFASPSEAIAHGLALVGEDRKGAGLVLDGSVLDNVTLATLRLFVRHGLLDHAQRRARAQEQADSLRLKAPSLLALVRQLSGGNQQKVVLGKWLLTRPRVLLLDEPTRGIDVGAKAEVYELVAALARGGLGVVLVSSELPEVLGMSHRVLVLSQGRPAGVLEGDASTPEAVMAAATAGARA
jgi:D-xylose transport system ATP-binding protein